MMEMPGSDQGLRRAAVRALVRSAQSECRVLRALLPGDAPWSGPASWVYRARVAGLGERVELASIALAVAELEL